MPNVRQAAKRARQSEKRRERNTIAKSATKTALKKAVKALQSKDTTALKEAYVEAVKALDKAAGKGILPKRRASRKISRLTALMKKNAPDALNFTSK